MKNFLLFVLFVNLSFSQQNETFVSANEKYNSGDFVTAIKKYNEIIINADTPPFKSFFLDRIIGEMKKKDSIEAENGKIQKNRGFSIN